VAPGRALGGARRPARLPRQLNREDRSRRCESSRRAASAPVAVVDVTLPAALHRRMRPGVRLHRHDLLPVDRGRAVLVRILRDGGVTGWVLGASIRLVAD
jgi:hypothetical protein